MADMKTLKETLLSGGYDSVLKEVYLYDDCLAQQRKRYADVIDSFINLFGADRIGGLYSAPAARRLAAITPIITMAVCWRQALTWMQLRLPLKYGSYRAGEVGRLPHGCSRFI